MNMMNLKKVLLLLFICGVFGDEVNKVSVMEGESVTLDSDLTETQTYWKILWRFDSDLIAQMFKGNISYKPVPDGRFRGRLQLESKTASLTITNMKMKHSGLYKREAISTTSGTTYKTFSVSVFETPSAIHVVEAEMKSVYVTPGESLTLQIDVPDPHRDELIVWRFGEEGKLIAKADLEAKNSYINTDERFRDRLTLDKTGSLTITSFKYTDSGLYLVKISSSKQTLHKRFIVTVIEPGWSPVAVIGIVVGGLLAVYAVASVAAGFLYYRRKMGEEKKETKTEGGSVDLFTGVTELHTDDEIQWWYGAENNLIAEITGGEGKTYDGDDERFSGKLTLDKKTGNLNISDIKIILSGLYKLKITRKSWIISRHKRFILTVNLNIVKANVGDKNLTLSIFTKAEQEDQIRSISDLLLQEDVLILWKFGPQGSAIAKCDRAIKKNTTYDVSDERFEGKLKLDERTGSLTIKNITTEHTGVYKLQLSNSKRTINRKFRVIVTEKGGNESATSEKSPLNGEDLDKINEHSV